MTKIPIIPTTQADAMLCPISVEMQSKSNVIINSEFLSLPDAAKQINIVFSKEMIPSSLVQN